jgi:uncharacterized spore protein YtfJ
MSTDIEQETKSGRSENMLERLANRIGGNVRVKTIFGDPVEKDGVTVIPVARARWGFGGGSNSDGNTRENQTGEGTSRGGGGRVTVSPAGYVEVRDGRARFHPIYDPANVAQIIVASGIVAVLVIRGVRRLMAR